MEREEQLERIAKDYLGVRYFNGLMDAWKYYHAHCEEIDTQLVDSFREGIRKCKQKEIKYIIISILGSSILTKCYDLQIAFFDEKIYLDEHAVYQYWAPRFLFESIDNDMQDFYKEASRTVIRIKKCEIERIRKLYVANHYFQVFLFLKRKLPVIWEKSREGFTHLDENISILFGRYMERPTLLYPQDGDMKEMGIIGLNDGEV